MRRPPRLVLGSCLLACLAAAGCGGGEVSVATTPLSGMIDGQAWTVGTAETNAFFSAGAETFYAEAYAETVAPCTGAAVSLPVSHLILHIPKVAGRYPLSLSALTETFYVQRTSFNDVALTGVVVVDSVTDTTVSGGAHFQFDSNNFVDGQFQAQICPAQ